VGVGVLLVIGELDFGEDDLVAHPESARVGRLWMQVDAGTFALVGRNGRWCPFAGVELHCGVVGLNDVNEDVVFLGRVQAVDLILELWEHATALFGDDHFGCELVKPRPQRRIRQVDFNVRGLFGWQRVGHGGKC